MQRELPPMCGNEPNPASAAPDYQLSLWRVVLVGHAGPPRHTTIHLVGCDFERMRYRVSSEIQTYDASTSCVATSTGRIYRLAGPTQFDAGAAEFYRDWLAGTYKRRFRQGVVGTGASFPKPSVLRESTRLAQAHRGAARGQFDDVAVRTPPPAERAQPVAVWRFYARSCGRFRNRIFPGSSCFTLAWEARNESTASLSFGMWSFRCR